MLDTEFNFHPIGRLLPFVEVGAGDAINTLKYSEAEAPDATLPGGTALNLQTQTKNNLAYELGVDSKCLFPETV